MIYSMSYPQHEKLGHQTTWYSPNGIDKIEECECGARYFRRHNSKYPNSLTVHMETARKWYARIDAAIAAEQEKQHVDL